MLLLDVRVTTYRPRLRAHIHVEDGKLTDWLLHRSFPVDGAAAALVERLDGEAAWDAVRAELIAGGHAEGDVDAALRSLLYLHAVEGAGDELSARLERVVARTEAIPTSILAGARFGCQGSGGCCQGYTFGPLTDDDVARLDALDLAGAFPAITGPYVEQLEHGRYLKRDGDRCVFLAGDRRCGIHAAFGAGAKPGFCQLYPLDSFGTVEGIRVVDRGTCATFGVSARTGLPLVDDLARVRPLLDPPLLHHPVVQVDGWPWDYGLFLRFTTGACDLVRQDIGTASDTLAAIGRMLAALAATMQTCPLEPGQPDGVVADVLATPAAAWYAGPGDGATTGLRRLTTLLGDLTPAMSSAIEQGRAQSWADRFREVVALLEHVSERLTAGGDGDGAPAGDAARAPAGPGHGPDVDEALRISLRQQLFGRHVLVGGHAGAGLVRIGMIHLLALASARLAAGDRPLTAADLSRGHMVATRVLHTGAIDGVLLIHEPRWPDLIDGIAAAARLLSA